MRTHELKCWPHAFRAIREGRKTFEVRSNLDRDFAEGDYLLLRKWDPEARAAGGFDRGNYITADDRADNRPELADTISALVTYVLHGGRFGLPDGLCVMSIVAESAAKKSLGGEA